MITDRVRGFMADLRYKSRRDKGFALVSVMLLFVLLTGVTYAVLGTTNRSIQNARSSRDFVQAGQLVDYAIQDAVYQFNNAGSTAPSSGSGTSNAVGATGTWSWHADPVTVQPGGKGTTIHATGTFLGVTRNADVVAGSVRVGGYTVASGGEITYQVAPSSAMNHMFFGQKITAQNGINVGSGATFVSGNIAVTGGNAVNLAPASGTTATAAVTYLLYGQAAANANAGIPNATLVPVGLQMENSYITTNLNTCGGSSLPAWTASHEGGRMIANGNVACYSSMNFDQDTQIIGSGAINVFVSGDVNFNAGFSAPPGAELNIYTNGNVYFNTENVPAGDTSETLQNVFVYAPQGTCGTQPFRSISKALAFSGGLACNTVSAAGSFTPITPTGVLGDDVYNSDVWYLVNYHQLSGSRG